VTLKRSIYESTHEEFRQVVAEFARRELVPHVGRWERDGIVDRDLFLKAGEAGLLGMAVPEEFGGGGTDDFRYNAVRIEELCRADVLTPGQGIGLHEDICLPYFLKWADDEQRKRWLPGLASGALIAAIAMTEPGTGSDLRSISTRAVRHGDHYVVNGAKLFTSNGILADLVIVLCATSDDVGSGISLLVVERGMTGFERGRNLAKIGMHAQDTSELFFDDVVVPAANLLGEAHQGFRYVMHGLAQERLQIAVSAVAQAEAVFDETLGYTKERTAFGRPIASFQNSRFALATMRTELDIARIYIDQLVLAHSSGQLSDEDAAMSKWWASELSFRTIDACLQLHGGYGYMEEYPIARHWRDSRLFRIGGGSNEIMKEIIGRRVLGV
jgi:alkylation response protein AidB-like acyl-CoA dehydrogenase